VLPHCQDTLSCCRATSLALLHQHCTAGRQLLLRWLTALLHLLEQPPAELGGALVTAGLQH
jgi:hypothetical protein